MFFSRETFGTVCKRVQTDTLCENAEENGIEKTDENILEKRKLSTILFLIFINRYLDILMILSNQEMVT